MFGAVASIWGSCLYSLVQRAVLLALLAADDVTLVQHKESLKRALVLWNRSASQGKHFG